MYQSDFLNEISSRGFIHQVSDINSLDEYMKNKKITGYIGFDPTSDDLHVGSLVQIMMLHWMQHYNHKPIILMGGGTTLIGDPSGKDNLRRIMSNTEINENIKKIEKTFANFIDFTKDAIILNNNDWLKDLNYIDFLRNFGSKITVNRMLTFDSVKSRLDREQPLTFLEFNYMLLQSYDFLFLNKNYECMLQIGGSDQWGNIVNGIELIRKINNKNVFGLTSPLITNNDGSKMGKTISGAVWLNREKLSNFDFFQFWRNIDDNNVEKFLKLFTKLRLSEIDRLSKLKGNEINEAKKILAYEITKMCRGTESAQEAMEMASNIFESKTIDSRITSKEVLKSDILEDKFSLIDALQQLNLISSRSEAKRIIKSGGVKINDLKVSENEYSMINYLENENDIKIALGKKKIGIIKISK
tara:strand:+ start:3350 stop:4591 length:1242 start_codon:yes stop_codon:yes gene_type:complete